MRRAGRGGRTTLHRCQPDRPCPAAHEGKIRPSRFATTALEGFFPYLEPLSVSRKLLLNALRSPLRQLLRQLHERDLLRALLEDARQRVDLQLRHRSAFRLGQLNHDRENRRRPLIRMRRRLRKLCLQALTVRLLLGYDHHENDDQHPQYINQRSDIHLRCRRMSSRVLRSRAGAMRRARDPHFRIDPYALLCRPTPISEPL